MRHGHQNQPLKFRQAKNLAARTPPTQPIDDHGKALTYPQAFDILEFTTIMNRVPLYFVILGGSIFVILAIIGAPGCVAHGRCLSVLSLAAG
jgi:hypothetical protein